MTVVQVAGLAWPWLACSAEDPDRDAWDPSRTPLQSLSLSHQASFCEWWAERSIPATLGEQVCEARAVAAEAEASDGSATAGFVDSCLARRDACIEADESHRARLLQSCLAGLEGGGCEATAEEFEHCARDRATALARDSDLPGCVEVDTADGVGDSTVGGEPIPSCQSLREPCPRLWL